MIGSIVNPHWDSLTIALEPGALDRMSAPGRKQTSDSIWTSVPEMSASSQVPDPGKLVEGDDLIL